MHVPLYAFLNSFFSSCRFSTHREIERERKKRHRVHFAERSIFDANIKCLSEANKTEKKRDKCWHKTTDKLTKFLNVFVHKLTVMSINAGATELADNKNVIANTRTHMKHSNTVMMMTTATMCQHKCIKFVERACQKCQPPMINMAEREYKYNENPMQNVYRNSSRSSTPH